MSLSFEQLIANQQWQESRNDPNAVSHAGASGLMQIMPNTARDPGFGVAPMDWNQRFDPKVNKAFGVDYMSAMLKRYGGDQARALVAYNWGAGNADKWDGDPGSLPAETRGYIKNILGGAAAPADGGMAAQGAPTPFDAPMQPPPQPDPANFAALLAPPTPPNPGIAPGTSRQAPAAPDFMQVLQQAVRARAAGATEEAGMALQRPQGRPMMLPQIGG